MSTEKFLSHVAAVKLEIPPTTYSIFKEKLLSVRRRRYALILLLLCSPYAYKYLRRRLLESNIYQQHRQRNESFTQHLTAAQILEKKESRNKVTVDKAFYEKLRFVLRIVIPGWRTKEALMLLLHSLFLVARTYLSVVVARIDGRIVRDLVAGNGKEFLRGLGYWFAIAIPATYTNSMIRYLQSKLALAFRTRLTNHVHDKYLESLVYYKVLNLDSRISGPDQLICTDIARFCDSLSALYSNLAKPVLDIIIFNYQLTRSIGAAGMVTLFVNYAITAKILRVVTPGFGKLAAVEAKLEGDFRGAHSRLITNAEEIAFYHGGSRELGILDNTYRTLIRHVNRIYRIRIFYNMFEDFVIKYSWSAVGLLVCSVPVFFPSWAGVKDVRSEGSNAAIEDSPAPSVSHSSRTQGFITNKRLMISLADAGGRIMYSFKEMAELAGYTARVYELLTVFQELSDNVFQKTMVSQGEAELPLYSLDEAIGMVRLGFDGIKLSDVPVITPSGDLLIKEMTFHLKPGMHVLVTGPNGVGKSAIMRIIAGLWPIFAGVLDKPDDREIIYIPQRPYLSLGTLRDQVIYPHNAKDFQLVSMMTDDDLLEILKIVHLDYLPEREGGWDVQKEWKDVLSGGEKQRMNLARLFYHRPKYAVLDEATSAVSSDVEGLMYSRAKEMGTSLLTISHKPSLLKHHDYQLKIKGAAGSTGSSWEWIQLNPKSARVSVENEIASINAVLEEEQNIKTRIASINQQLGVKANAIKK